MTSFGLWLSGPEVTAKGTRIRSRCRRPISRWTSAGVFMAAISASIGWSGFSPSALRKPMSMQAA